MIDTLCILGRQPALGLAELESLFGSDNIRPVGSYSAIIKIDPTLIDFTRLGGTIKFCKILTVLDTTDWAKIQGYLEKVIPEHIANLQTGKMKLGLSVYGLDVSAQKINSTNLSLKKVIKTAGRSIRVIPNVEKTLNSAQVLHNQLTGPLGWELVFVRDGKKTILAQNIAEQDIEAYAARDQARPKRDTKVGMLPPKLAQIIINMAIGQVEPVDPSCGPIKNYDKTILDPFCGTGVVLQEALLMGYGAYGTDLEQKMVEYSQTNLEWLRLDNKRWELEVGD
ncbi:MAG TPA: hypothetical protein VLG25_03365, partial [Patescibacteria group bacterium]|nr:hypothetical protein [Patescibacteria group bacterium]